MKTLYISSLDGILLGNKKEVTNYATGIINWCIEAEVLLSVATARMPYGCDHRLRQLNLQILAILTDGVFIYDFSTKKYLHTERIERDTVRKVIGVSEKNKKSCFMYSFYDEQINICYGDDSLKAQRQYYNKKALESREHVYRTDDFRKEMEQRDVVYFALTGTEQELEPICRSLDQARGIHRTCYLNIYNEFRCLEVFSYRAGKRHTLLRLEDTLGCSRLVVFEGDHNNMPMIEITGRSYTPANALEVVKQAVMDVLGDCDHDGVAKFLGRGPGM